MKKRNKYIISLVFLLVITFSVIAQESIQPMYSNPFLKGQKNIKKSARAAVASKALPFFDDFSYASATQKIPDQNLWFDKNVYVNYNYGKLPISIGVATFDALDANGKLYEKAAQAITFGADTLTSCYINLSNRVPADSIFLSFFYQAGGFGEMPEAQDVLILQFSRPGTIPLYWDTVWTSADTMSADFIQKIQAVNQEYWLKDSFQFRFVNKASINIVNNDPGRNTNGDIWNLDYVYMNNNRTSTDSAYQQDYAIIYPPFQSMINKFESIPWKQFKSPTVYGQVRADRISIPVVNHRDEAVYLETQFTFSDVYSNLEMESTYNSTPVEPDSLFYVQEAVPNLASDVTDSALFEVRLTLVRDSFDNPVNNTVSYYQVMSDYFAYDDGSPEYGYGISGEGANNAMLAMRFETFDEELLSSVRIFMNESLDPRENISKQFYLTIWNEKIIGGTRKIPGDTLYKKVLGSFNSQNKWVTFTLDSAVVVPKIFYVGWIQQSEYFANVGFDRNRNAKGNTYYNLQGTPSGWQQSDIDGALMIRPVIDPKANVKKSTESIMSVNIYPNPATSMLNFDVPESFQGGNFKLQISSISGLFNMVKEQSQTSLNIDHLQPGIYILKITGPDGTVMTSKFLKNAR